MFKFWGFYIEVVRAEVGLMVRLYSDIHDPEPCEYYTPSRDPYCVAALLKTDLDLYREEDIILLGEIMDAHI
jgi:hypothetical protein